VKLVSVHFSICPSPTASLSHDPSSKRFLELYRTLTRSLMLEVEPTGKHDRGQNVREAEKNLNFLHQYLENEAR